MTKDAYGENDNPESRYAHKVDIGNKAPNELWNEMLDVASKIDSRIDYEINLLDFASSLK